MKVTLIYSSHNNGQFMWNLFEILKCKILFYYYEFTLDTKTAKFNPREYF